MSEKTQDPQTQPKKMLLSMLLPKVERIAFGADAEDRLPGEKGHDQTTAPDKWTLWIAGVMRIHIRRAMEHAVEFRSAIKDLREKTRDIPALREQVKEMTGLLQEIVRQIEIARGQAPEGAPAQADAGAQGGEAAPAQGGPPAPPEDEEAPLDDKPLSPEAMLRRAEQAQVRDLAAKAARENVVPIPGPAKKTPKPANSGKSEPPAA